MRKLVNRIIGLALTPIADGIAQGYPERPYQSSAVDMLKAFWPVDRLLADLQSGEIFLAGAVPVMLDRDGSYGEIVPSLHGFCSCLERMAQACGIPLDTGPLLRIANRLQYGIGLGEADLQQAAFTVDRLKAVFLATPVPVRKQAWMAESIVIEQERLGWREAA